MAKKINRSALRSRAKILAKKISELALHAVRTFLFIVLAACQNVRADASSWSLPIDVPNSALTARDPQVAISSDGSKAVAVWSGADGTNDIVYGAVATIAANQLSWGPVTNLSAAGENAGDPQVKISSDGANATAVWVRSNGSHAVVESRSANISGNSATWGVVRDLSAADRNARSPQMALSLNGERSSAIWYVSNGSGLTVQTSSAEISGNSATWGIASSLSDVGYSDGSPQIALSSDGSRATAVWYRNDGLIYIVQTSSATITGTSATWSAAIDLSEYGKMSFEPQLGLSSDGTRVTAVWRGRNETNSVIQSKSATVSGNSAVWGLISSLSTSDQDAQAPQISLSSDGTKAIAVWALFDGPNTTIQGGTATITGNSASWGAALNISDGGQYADKPQIDFSADGLRAVAVWHRNNGAFYVIQSSAALVSGASVAWEPAAEFSAFGQAGRDPQVDLSIDGSRGIALWAASSNVIQSASYEKIMVTPTPTPTSTPIPTSTPEAVLTCTLKVNAGCNPPKKVASGGSCTFTITIKKALNGAAVPQARISLLRKIGAKPWAKVKSGISNAKGVGSIKLKVLRASSYQAAVDNNACKSKIKKILIR